MTICPQLERTLGNPLVWAVQLICPVQMVDPELVVTQDTAILETFPVSRCASEWKTVMVPIVRTLVNMSKAGRRSRRFPGRGHSRSGFTYAATPFRVKGLGPLGCTRRGGTLNPPTLEKPATRRAMEDDAKALRCASQARPRPHALRRKRSIAKNPVRKKRACLSFFEFAKLFPSSSLSNTRRLFPSG